MALKLTNTGNAAGVIEFYGNKVFHAGNDGAGSGLDADKLDAQEGSFYLDFGNFTNTPTTLAGYGITDGGSDQQVFKTISVQGQEDVVAGSTTDTLTLVGSGGITITTVANTDTITISHSDTSNQSTVDNTGRNVIQDVTLDARGHVTGLGSIDLSDHFIRTSDSDVGIDTDTQQTVGTNLTVNRQLRIGSPNDDTDSLIRFYNATSSPGDYNQIIGYNPSGSYFYISNNNGTTKNKIWHAGNDGAGSGLDADKLDGLHGVNYMRNRRTISNTYSMANTTSSAFDDSNQVSWTIRSNATTNYGWPENANYNVLSVGESGKFTQFAGQTDSDKVFHRNARSGSTSWYEMWTKANLSYPVQGYTGATSTASSGIQSIRTVTQTDYDNLGSKDANTLYLIPTA